MKNLSELFALWNLLGEIPTAFDGDDVDTIEEPFLHFPIGTHREDIWCWFELCNPIFFVGKAMSGGYTEFSPQVNIIQITPDADDPSALAVGEDLLMVQYNAGDCDTIDAVNPNMDNLIKALYDHYQCSDQWKDGDLFMLNKVIIAKCVDFHVVPTNDQGDYLIIKDDRVRHTNGVASLTNYTFEKSDLALIHNQYGVTIANDENAPHEVYYTGPREGLANMINTYWEDQFDGPVTADSSEIVDCPYIVSYNGSVSPVDLSFFCPGNGFEQAGINAIGEMIPDSSVAFIHYDEAISVYRLY